MPRAQRVVVVDCPHHVTQRGNRRQNVFSHDGERRHYLDLFAQHATRHGLEIWGYCLMTNHIHLVVVPRHERALADALQRVQGQYAQAFNAEHRLGGHLWQNRFFSCPLGARHRWAALAYVERNPVRADLVQHAPEWPWSSAAARLGLVAAPPWLTVTPWREVFGADDWRARLGSETMAESAQLRRATRHGRPWGDEAFVTACETLVGRPLRAKAGGRPAVARAAAAARA